jgi:isoaspartyl peptidase/L-asparaginase-like protein (Ntn-hydrolase superfamily)
VLLIGARADEHAAAAGAEQVANAYFVTERQRGLLETRRHADTHGTVGAVCLDDAGVLAAATSTGGITGQPAGRVGDSPLFGAGTWADDQVAVSCTGDGEAFVRTAAARYLAALVERGALPEPAADAALAEVATLGGSGGLIALDAHGRGAMPFLTEAMPRGRWHSGGEPEVWVP